MLPGMQEYNLTSGEILKGVVVSYIIYYCLRLFDEIGGLVIFSVTKVVIEIIACEV